MPIQQCVYCQCEYEPKRKTSRYCSSRCRVASHRKKGPSEAEAATLSYIDRSLPTWQRWQRSHRAGFRLGELLGFDYEQAIMAGLDPVRLDIIFVGELDSEYYGELLIRELFLRVRTSPRAKTSPAKLLGVEDREEYKLATPRRFFDVVMEIAKREAEEEEG